MQLQYGLGKANQDLGQYETAMRHFDEANRLAYKARFGEKAYDRRIHVEGVDRAKSTFTRMFLEDNRSGRVSDLPVLVVGMMRSGTTLVEQILSSHSQVGATGEQKFWPQRHREAFDPVTGLFDKRRAARLGDEYERTLRKVSDRDRLVDKMPANYLFLGVVHCALPKARIIHVRRHPVDTCLSIYTTPNRTRIEWCHDKPNIVFAYRQYLNIMEHWRSVLPSERFLEVGYEDLVLLREETTRRLIEFLNLDWEEACLNPEDNERSVVTPSVWQVRQPVYTSSLEKWRRYEPWLGEFKELL
jgi:hypothetical protein